MPLAFGAVHRRLRGRRRRRRRAGRASSPRPTTTTSRCGSTSCFNHTTEVDAAGPTYHLRGLADGAYYRLRDDGSYVETTGCGNDLDATSPGAQDLVVWSLDRLADLGVDGFRFDLAAVLARDAGFVDRLDRLGGASAACGWSPSRGTPPAPTCSGRRGRDARWLQWNDRFRDDVRGFLRGEAGLVAGAAAAGAGQPRPVRRADATASTSSTCHDGFTLYDLVAYDRKHNEANGWGGRDGTDDNRSWNCGWEGDDGVPAEVLALRRRQLRNAWCLLALSHGVPMVVAWATSSAARRAATTTPTTRTTRRRGSTGSGPAAFADLERFVAGLLALRAPPRGAVAAGRGGATA